MFNKFLFPNIVFFWDNVEKYDTAIQAADVNTERRMRFAWWITKGKDTRSEYIILLFHRNNGYANARECSAVYVLLVLLNYDVNCSAWRYTKYFNLEPHFGGKLSRK